MQKLFKLCLLVLMPIIGFGQAGFEFPANSKKVTIKFELEKNLVLLPVELNGVTMRFLLDTGVAETILFSLADKTEVAMPNVEKIKMRGLGDQDAVEGLKSSGNVLKTGGLVKKNEDVIVVLDESFNFSASLGIEVNGIIGSSFFENNIVEINYNHKKIIVHQNIETIRRLHKFVSVGISIENQKPYVLASV